MRSFEPGVRPIRVDQVIIGARRRKSVGDVTGLMESMRENDLLHPIVIRNGNELVSGQRRLEAARLLGWPTIPARDMPDCSDERARKVELEENTERRDLDPLERSEERLAQIDAVVARAKKEFRSTKDRKPGRPKTPGSTRDVERRLGVSMDEQNKIRRHVVLGERYAFLRQPEAGWRRAMALRAGDVLKEIPDEEHSNVDTLLVESTVQAPDGLRLLDHLVTMGPIARKAVYERAAGDPAAAAAGALRAIPDPDPAMILVEHIEPSAEKAVKVCQVPTIQPKLAQILALIKDVHAELAADHHGKLTEWRQALGE